MPSRNWTIQSFALMREKLRTFGSRPKSADRVANLQLDAAVAARQSRVHQEPLRLVPMLMARSADRIRRQIEAAVNVIAVVRVRAAIRRIPSHDPRRLLRARLPVNASELSKHRNASWIAAGKNEVEEHEASQKQEGIVSVAYCIFQFCYQARSC